MTMVNLGAVQALEFFFSVPFQQFRPVVPMQINDGARQALRYLWDVNILDWIPKTAP